MYKLELSLLLFLCICVFGKAAVPPKHPPPGVDFTLDGQIPMEYFHVDDTMDGNMTHFSFPAKSIDYQIKGVHATLMKIERMVEQAKAIGHTIDDVANRIPKEQWLYLALLSRVNISGADSKLMDSISGSKVLVVGSMTPWIECLMVDAGAAEVFTVEYNRLTFEHEKMHTIFGPEFPTFYAADSPYREGFDFIVSMSSLDHDGLGRYGDPIDPAADLKSMQRLSTMLKPGGLFIMTIPVGPDIVVFNLHRRYGRIRLPLLISRDTWTIAKRIGWQEEKLDLPANWRQSYEPIFVLAKHSTVENHHGNANIIQDSSEL